MSPRDMAPDLCPHGFELEPGEDYACHACLVADYPTQRDWDNRFDPRI